MVVTGRVSVSLEDLADALDTAPAAIRDALELAELLRGVRLVDDVAELPAHAVTRLGLVADHDGRWHATAGPDALRGGPRRRRRTVPLLWEPADRGAVEPLAELIAREEPTPDRMAPIVGWLERVTHSRRTVGTVS